eukprot:comp15933_c0_seq1/m.13327 comp15933_c0_seq1/g.13327  ORF comp15933_c0_seq1/g.13327 comp15933_c0_seq1/m.13327 type:complete len:258 (-) comp15933_c0_seq1:119-892(-)
MEEPTMNSPNEEGRRGYDDDEETDEEDFATQQQTVVGVNDHGLQPGQERHLRPVDMARRKMEMAMDRAMRGRPKVKTDPDASSDDGSRTDDFGNDTMGRGERRSNSSRDVRRKKKKGTDRGSKAVIKLYDQYVDLSPFPRETSLYALCRAWVHSDIQRPDDDPPPHTRPPLIPSISEHLPRMPILPSVDHDTVQQNLDKALTMDPETTPPLTQLRMGHLTRWKMIRKIHQEHYRARAQSCLPAYRAIHRMMKDQRRF